MKRICEGKPAKLRWSRVLHFLSNVEAERKKEKRGRGGGTGGGVHAGILRTSMGDQQSREKGPGMGGGEGKRKSWLMIMPKSLAYWVA